MYTAYSLNELHRQPDADKPAVVTIGNFDGVHLGHQAIMAAVTSRARQLHARSLVLTFDPHPSNLLKAGMPIPLITPLPQKLELLEACGVNQVVVLPFSNAIRTLSAEDFVQTVLCRGLHAVEVHEGLGFRFGHRAGSDIKTLRELGHLHGFDVKAHEPLFRRGDIISSSRIRRLVASGDMSGARSLMGRTFTMDSTPAPGRGYGSRYVVPTVNLAPTSELVPAHGVYISILAVGAGNDQVTFRGLTNAGIRPTFGAASYAIETHLFDFYPVPLSADTPLRLHFLHRLREERPFATSELLKQQIAADTQAAGRFFRICDALRCVNS